MSQYTNTHDLPLAMAVWLATDNYDHQDKPNYISTTALLKPIREIVLKRQNKAVKLSTDISHVIASRIGTAIHDSFERSWVDNYARSLRSLGYEDSTIDNILINPKPEEITPDSIPIYLENRMYKSFAGFTIGGKYDMVAHGVLHDVKTTGVYSYMLSSRDWNHKMQGSIYRWLNPELIKSDYIDILYVFLDWKKSGYNQQKDKGYPPHKILSKRIPLLSIEETEKYLTQRLALIESLENTPQEELPECNKEELWQGDSVYKYYKKPGAARSTKNFDSLTEANQRLMMDGGVGEVKEVKSPVNACKYCSAFEFCHQKDELILKGELVLDEFD